MFNDYESLKCDICEKEFIGRKPANGGDILCPDCIAAYTPAEINEDEPVPSDVDEEVAGGKGDE